MKTIVHIASVGLILFATNCFGSERTVSLEQKVMTSDVVLIGTVTNIHLGEIRRNQELFDVMAQDTTIRMRIDECIVGSETGEISFMAHSVSFSDDTGSQGASAGFSKHGVQKDKRFIAYLKKEKEGFVLAGESNQFLELITEDSKTVRDVGQTSRMVPMDSKRKQLFRLAAKKQEAQQVGTGQPATRPESKSEGGDKPQPESEGRSR